MNPQSEMVLIIRPSFKKICGPDACRAALYNHILYRLARKAKDEPDKKVKEGEIFWFASAEDICKDIDEAWCVNKIRKEIKELVDAGLIGQRHNPAKGWDRKFQYYVGKEQGKRLLEKSKAEGICLLHIGLNSEVLHLLHMVNAFTKNGACMCQKEEVDLPNMEDASTINGGAIPEGSLQGSIQENVAVNTASTPSSENVPLQLVPTEKPKRRPPKPKIDPEDQKRIDHVYEALDELMREVMEDPQAHYQRSQKSTDAIKDLLDCKPTSKRLRKVFYDMWNEKDRDGNHWWRKRMTVPAICSQYTPRLMNLEGKDNPKQGEETGPRKTIEENHTPKAGEPRRTYKMMRR